MIILFMIAILFLLILIGAPIYIALLGSSFFYIALSPNLNFLDAVQKIVNAPNSFILLAVPFFVLVGQLMNSSGITNRIFYFCKVFLGHLPGGLGYVNVLSSLIFSGMSGTATADVGGLGMVEIQTMRQAKYDDDFTFGVTAASSIVGPIIPPSSSFILYGAFTGVSVGGLFIAGIVPGLLISLTLFVAVFIFARKRNYPVTPRASLAELWLATKNSFFALLTPPLIVGSIWTGIVTPTEAAMLSLTYVVVISVFVYRDVSLRDFPKVILQSVGIVSPAIMIVVGAFVFGTIMNYEKIDQILLKLILGYTDNRFVILLLINLLLFVLGMFLDVIAAMLLLLPILEPMVAALGIEPIQFGVIMVLNLMIGLLTPPVGIVLYVLASGTGTPVNKVIRYVSPWIFPLLVALILVNAFPFLTMFLPQKLGFA